MLLSRLLICAAAISVLCLLPGAASGQPTENPVPEKLLRKLEKDIEEVRGLKFKTPVVARVIPRPKGGAKKIQGYYSIKEKTLYLHDDVSGAYERGVLIHEMVHALQDQHFGLRNLHQTTFGSDAELALAALIEGDATLTMIELLKKEQPRVAGMLDAPLDKAKDVRNAFLYAQGARYVQALKESGGWAAVNARYRFPPQSTAQVLHPTGVKTITLGPGTVRGELALVEMLAAQAQTAPLALEAAAGWKADCFNKAGDRSWWSIALATRDDALQLQAALSKLRPLQDPSLKSSHDRAGENVWRGESGQVVGVLARSDRVLVLEAPDEKAYRALLDRVEGPPAVVVYSAKDKAKLTFAEFIDRLLEADVVCVGETHDNDLHHRLQLQIIKGLFARDERLAVGMEMFQRPYQKEIDRYLRGEVSEEYFLKVSEYHQRWGFDWGLYRPIVEFCRKNGLPVAALNVPRELTRRVSNVGHAALTEDEKKQLGEVDFQVKAHRDHWFERLAQMHGQSKATPEQKERGYQVMTVWDEYMAASAAQFQRERHVRRLVVLAGSGHIDRGFGIPDRAAKRGGGRVVNVRLDTDSSLEKVSADPLAEYTIVVAN